VFVKRVRLVEHILRVRTPASMSATPRFNVDLDTQALPFGKRYTRLTNCITFDRNRCIPFRETSLLLVLAPPPTAPSGP
jgi:hypothetical protein